MRILFLAPQPYFQERGTTIAIDLLLQVLAERGDSVDVLTLHLGEDRDYPNVSISRVRPAFAPASVPPGFSFRKLYCDLYLFKGAVSMLRRQRYDLIYAVEEAAFIAMVLSRASSTPYVFDMDSSMAEQLIEDHRWMGPARGLLRWIETLPMRGAAAVIPMCDDLARQARRHARGLVHVLKDVSLLGDAPPARQAENLRESLGIEGPMLMYIGNLKAYQGIDLLLEAHAALHRVRPDAELVVIGGGEPELGQYRRKAAELGIADRVHLVGARPVEALAGFLEQADLLVSPRTQGTNTPMKIYSYLDSGVPVVATALPTHTQVMSEQHAALTPPAAPDMAAAMARLLADPDERTRLAANARSLVRAEHSRESFRTSVHAVFEQLEARISPAVAQRLPVEP